MPITVTYDVTNLSDDNDRPRIVSAFVRLGWEHVGGTAFRYPRFGHPGPEDWLNCVVPALFFLRSFVLAKGITMSTFTIDTHSASWIQGTSGAPAAEGGKDLPLVKVPKGKYHLSEKKLTEWVDAAIDSLR